MSDCCWSPAIAELINAFRFAAVNSPGITILVLVTRVYPVGTGFDSAESVTAAALGFTAAVDGQTAAQTQREQNSDAR